MIAISAFYSSIYVFRKEKINRILTLVPIIVAFFPMFYFSMISFNLRLSLLFTSSFAAFYYFLILKEFINLKFKIKKPIIAFYGLMFIFFTLFALRTFFPIDINLTEKSYISSVILNIINLLFNVFLVFFMVTEELISDLNKSVILEKESNNKLKDIYEEREELLLTISHDLKTPLNGILGMTELALISGNNKKDEYLNTINSSAKHMDNLIYQILNKDIENRKRVLDISELMNEISNNFKKKCSDKNLNLIIYNSIKIPDNLYGEYDILKQILFNIIEKCYKIYK